MKIYCDGGSRGNPGPGASAFVVYNDQGEKLYEQGVYLGISTNNQAEYEAVILALKHIRDKQYAISNIDFYLDSLLVVNQLKGLYKIKDEKLQSKKNEIDTIIKNLKLKIENWHHIPRELNSKADYLVNQTLDASLK